MPDWAIWVIVAAVLAGGEMLTVSLFLGPVALAAGATAIVAAVGAGTIVQLVVFVIASLGTLALVRPIARRHLRMPAHLRTGTAALIGAGAVVTERIDGTGGQVKLAGEIWSARAYDDGRVFEPGTRVSVLQIEGATALVSD
ncbi:MAG TPA: NfeD family protein [Gaiellaceae bacterium]|nr:NfeD family protein [Gaiellaceae bacterium]